tara:strand:- start:558 stop:833 length:276 start_codon:yes stop_codon:yes gene_type:complete
MSKPKPGSYIDTQGMSGPTDPNAKDNGPVEYKPMMVTPRRMHTPQLVKELKILINEVLDEREGRTGISYFDVEQFKHTVEEEEPPYREWSK